MRLNNGAPKTKTIPARTFASLTHKKMAKGNVAINKK